MPRLTVTITEEQSDLLDEMSGDAGAYESKSAAVRNFLQAGEERQALREEIARLEDRLESREARVAELEEQLARRSQVEEKVDVLAERVEDRERAADAPFFVRWARWFRSGD
jgi:Arc/MetJ-type ribon-helix-helix transcriptional regulator